MLIDTGIMGKQILDFKSDASINLWVQNLVRLS